MLSRRNFIAAGSILMARAAFPATLAAFAVGKTAEPRLFSPDELQALRALVDVILPETDSPAASAARTHEFIDLAASACATPSEQRVFRNGIADLEHAARSQYQRGFSALPAEKQADLLRARAEPDYALPYEQSFFRLLKDYTLVGYFHSEIGGTQALAYDPIPGGYQADIPLQPNQKAWTL